MGVLTRLMRPRNTEVTTSADLDRLLRGGSPVWSGVSVTPESAVQVATVFACVRVIAEDIGKLPFPLYQKSGDGARDRATASPFWRLIHDRPNAWQTSQEFREYLTACALLRGNGYALKNSIGGQVRELLPLHPDKVRVEQLDDFEVVYHVTMASGRVETKTRREVFHLRGLSMDGGVTGVSVVTLARQTIGLAMGQERHAATFFGKGMQPGGVFTHPKALSDEAYERLKAELHAATSGDNSNSTLVLEDGMSWVRVGLSHEDSQFLESRQFSRIDICEWFRVAPHKVQDFSRAHFNNIEASNLDHVTDTLMPWAVRWNNAVNGQVIGTNSVWAELLFDALLRGTTKERYEAYQLAAGGNAPWMTRNEIRVLENKPPLPGLDEVLTPLNMGGAAGDAPEEGEGDGPEDRAPAH